MPSVDALAKWLFWAPWLGLLTILFPLLLLGLLRKIFPTQRMIWTVLGLSLASLAIVALPLVFAWGASADRSSWVTTLQLNSGLLVPFIGVLDLVLLVVFGIDLVTIAMPFGVKVRRQMLGSGSLGATHKVILEIENWGKRQHRMIVRDDLPADMQANPSDQEITLASGKRAELHYQLRPNRRGAFRLERVYFQLCSLLGFWKRYVDLECESSLSVYPNMQQLREYSLLAKTNRLSLIGVRTTRQIGQDNNFERLRDYSLDDNYKHMDWRATARRGKLTVKQFQQDKSQRIVFLLDCGRLMTNHYRGLSLLDYAMNSILMMSYVALQQGDSVGMVCFSNRVEKVVPLRGGSRQMNHLLHGLFDRFPSMVQSNYEEAFLQFSKSIRRRTMVVLITNVIDETTASQVTGYLSMLKPKHLPVLCLLRDRSVFEMADNPALEDGILYPSAAAAQILLWRHELLQKVKDSGALVVDAFPDQLTSAMVNRYLEVKAKHML